MSFKSWPNEILLQLLSDNVLSRKDLFSIAQVNRNFSEVAAVVLYRNIRLSFEVDAARRLYFIKRAVEENCRLAFIIRSIDLEWIYDEKTAKLFRHNLRSVLSKAPNLDYLDLGVRTLEKDKYWSHRHYHRASRNGTPPPAPFINDMAKLMLLPKLRRFLTKQLHNGPWAFESIPTRPPGTSCSIQELGLGPRAHPIPAVQELLKWPDALEKLYYDVGEYADSQRIHTPPLSCLIAAHANTLVSLDIRGYLNADVHSQKINFSNFSRLQTLHITQAFLFPTIFEDDGHQTWESEPRNGLYKRLPKTLKKLKVFFDCASTILDHRFTPWDNFQIEENYDWIEELATEKEYHLPALQCVYLSEHSSCWTEGGPHRAERLKNWDVPETLAGEFEQRQIHLKVRVRKWYNYDSDASEDDETFRFLPNPRRSL